MTSSDASSTPREQNLRRLTDRPTVERPPRYRVVSADEVDWTEAELAVKLGNTYTGVTLYDWQSDIVLCWLSKTPDGKYAHPTCVLIVPRQNGKSKGIIIARILAGLIFHGEIIRYSAHRVDTMLEVWNIIVDIFGDTRLDPSFWEHPELHALVKRMSHQNGHLYIELLNGGKCSFVARSKGSGRGNTVDVNIIDEAQYMTQEQLSDAAPSQSAAPHGNPQIIYAGTPPDYKDAMGEVFEKVRENGIKGKGGICLHEWSVPEIGDIYDKSRWYATNPALGYSLNERTIEINELFGGMDEETFARERLAYWTKQRTEEAVSKNDWLDSRIEKMPEDFDKMCIGVKFSPNGSTVAISVATLKEDDAFGALIKCESKETATGIDWLVDDIYKQRANTALVAIDGKSGAEDLKNRLIQKGMSKKAVQVMETRQVVAAATMLNSYIEDGKLSHVEDKCLDSSAMSSKKRKIGTDGYGFGGDSIPIESFAAAHWAVRTTKRNPMHKVKGLNYG